MKFWCCFIILQS